MNKLEQAARQALETFEPYGEKYPHIITALRKALAEQVHTPYCKQAPMCKTPCGNSDCVEQAEQEPVAVVGFDTQSWRNLVDALTKLPDGTKLYAEPANKTEEKPLIVQAWEKRCAEQVEQEQVAVLDITYGREPECYATPNAGDLPEGTYRLYAAPVRTKNLTDDAIDDIALESGGDLSGNSLVWFSFHDYYKFARAVIAADRGKNK